MASTFAGSVTVRAFIGTFLRIDGGPLSDKAWLNSLPDDYVRQKPELNRLAIKGANLTDGELAELGLKRTETQTMKFTAAA